MRLPQVSSVDALLLGEGGGQAGDVLLLLLQVRHAVVLVDPAAELGGREGECFVQKNQVLFGVFMFVLILYL